MTFFTAHHLPFNILNSQQFKNFIDGTAQLASVPSIPSPRTLSRHLRDESLNQQITALSTLPEGSKLSIALDCWTSPFHQAFIAITGYFLDLDWNYREVLLGFEPLYGAHSGKYNFEVD
jgi:hypothetical protein